MYKAAFFLGSSGDWGGASRVLFTTLRLLDRSRFSPLVLLNREGPGTSALEQLHIPYEVWGPMNEFQTPVAYLRAIMRTIFWLRAKQIDLVHVNRANDWRPAEYIAARLCGVPIVTHFHTVNRDCAPATKMATAIVAVSKYVATHCCSLGTPVYVIHNVVDVDRFASGKDIRKGLGYSDTDILVTFIGQIREIKGVRDFVEMTKLVIGTNVRFLIVGECRPDQVRGDAYTEEQLAALIGSNARIAYLGYRTDIENIYCISDIVVVPSRWQEPFGLVNVEAGAAGKPVVATRVGGIPEIIVDKETGLLVSAKDVKALAGTVQKLVDNPRLRYAFGQSARRRVEQSFSVEPIRQLESLFASLIEGHKGMRGEGEFPEDRYGLNPTESGNKRAK